MKGNWNEAVCGGCEATWTARTFAHCGACHMTFSGISLFDAHRRGGVCLPATDVADRLVDGVWRGPEMSDAALSRMKKAAS